MSNYTKTTDFEAKDSLPTGDSGKIIRGAEFETEFDAISTAIATKADTAGPTFTGTLTFETISDGTIGVTAFVDEDDMSSDSATLVPTQQSVKAYVDSQVGANNELSEILANGNTTGGTNIVFGDSASVSDDRLVFGAGSDLQIYHSGVHSYIDDAGTGNLTLRGNASVRVEKYEGEILADFAADGAVSLYHDNSVKIATTSTGVNVTGNVAVSGTVDGRDVATDGTKLDGIEAGATADQTAAEIRTLVESATDSNVFTDADHSKLDGIEAGADVTDTTNVTAAGALMDSELTSEASVKALNQGVATTDSPTFAGVTVNGTVEFDGLSGTGAVSVTDILDQDDMSSNSATALATQQSIKAYVDSQVATVDTLAEVLGNGNTTGGTDIAVGTGDDITFADSSKAIFGAGSDLQIYHDGSNSYIEEQGVGDLYIRGSDYILFQTRNAADTAWEAGIVMQQDAGVTLYHDANAKLATTSTGIDVTGTVTADKASITTVADFGLELDTGTAGDGILKIGHFSNGTFIGTYNDDGGAGDALRFGTHSGETRLRIDSNGDISFYEDTSTTAKLFWDASAEALGLGTSTIGTLHGASYGTTQFHIDGGTDRGQVLIEGDTLSLIGMSDNGATADSRVFVTLVNDGVMTFKSTLDNGSTKADIMSLTSAGNVGIGTSSPADKAHVNGGNVQIQNSNASLILTDSGNSNYKWLLQSISSGLRFYNSSGSSEALRIASTGNVGIGTSSPSSALHISGDYASNKSDIQITNTNGGRSWRIGDGIGAITSKLVFWDGTAGASRMVIDSSGRIGIGTINPLGNMQIVTDTAGSVLNVNHNTGGTYPKASGIGLGATSTALSVSSDGSTVSFTGGAGLYAENTAASGNPTNLVFWTNATGSPAERMRIDSSGNLLVGKTATGYSANGAEITSTGLLYLPAGSASAPSLTFSGDPNTGIGFGGADILYFSNGGSESARLDASGNLLVGKTSASASNTGAELRNGVSTHAVLATSSSATPIQANRKTNDGSIIDLLKDGVTVGSIGVEGSDLTIGTGDTGLQFRDASDAIRPFNISTNAARDANIDLGRSSERFRDLYLSGDVIAPNIVASNGVFLGGTSNANKLDDYEEGTWTATLNTTNGDATVSAGNTTGYYVKIGNLVTVSWYSAATNISAIGTGIARVTNLPFTASNGSIEYFQGICTHCTALNAVTGYVSPGSTFFVPIGTNTSSGVSLISGSTRYIMMQATYRTA